uniref:EF-hand domain-containing protein n=1 Tax=Ananas comosus var. bracteatus TaxID=296719 RepID=A0A6V7QQL6_ANACO
MGKSHPNPIVWIYVALTLFVVLLLSFAPTHHHLRPHRRLKLRSSFAPRGDGGGGGGGHQVPFDPLIADIERRREDREWERAHYNFTHGGGGGGEGDAAPGMESQPEWEEFMDAEDYINDEDRFNVTRRIEELFPKVDVAPADGAITAEELTEWNLAQAQREVMHRTQRDLELHDKNRDGFISFAEYEPPSWAHTFHENNTTNDGMGWWKEAHFNASDVDGDGLLNLTEFNDFLHPADSANPKIIHWLCQEEIRERDQDKDGKLNFQEFFNGLFSLVRAHDEVETTSHETDSSREAPAKKLFSQLDKDKDGLLSADELKPVIGNIHPSEHYYAKQQADYVLSQADTDKDGRLSLKEMIENPYVFYSSIFAEDDYGYHDEFR